MILPLALEQKSEQNMIFGANNLYLHWRYGLDIDVL